MAKKNRTFQALYAQLKDIIREQIRTGKLAPGAAIPDLSSLAHKHGLSEMTARRALIELAEEGILQRIRGRGTFVSMQATDTMLLDSSVGARSVAVLTESGRSDLIGHWFYHGLLEGIASAAEKEGFALVFKKLASAEAPRLMTELATDRRITGCIAISFMNAEILNALSRLRKPVVLLDCHQPTSGKVLDEVTHDDEQAAFEAVQHLVVHGHKRIAIMLPAVRSIYFQQRLRGYERALRANQLPVRSQPVINCILLPGNAYSVARQTLAAPDRPSAFFCTTDELATGVMWAALEAGLRIPEDISVIGFGDSPGFTAPQLSTVNLHTREMGARALLMLNNRVKRPSLPVQREVVQATWMQRASSGSVPVARAAQALESRTP
ncbi:MAG TPA: GntR family transcriptional regulator [Planctomycetota bacterium]|nr:GntR family transcriptional regulator [Planctomycetota bacterium]